MSNTQQYRTVRGHEPLRVPAGWSGQDKALIVQLERLLDDIYRRFGRIRKEDLGPELNALIDGILGDLEGIRERLSDAEDDIDDLQSDMSTAQGGITTLQGDMSTAKSNITTLQGNYSSLSGELTALYSLTVTQLKSKGS